MQRFLFLLAKQRNQATSFPGLFSADEGAGASAEKTPGNEVEKSRNPLPTKES